MESLPVSILLPTFNCEAFVRRTLESVKWAEEILVVDSGSSDHTMDICHAYGARILEHEYINSAAQKNWAVPHCKHPWVLQVDSDEWLEAGLCDEIMQTLSAVQPGLDAFRIPRKNLFLGAWMRYGGNYPDYQIRLFRRDMGKWQDREVHAHLTVPGKVGTLQRHLMHDDAPYLAKPLRNLDRYTRYEADELHKRGVTFRGYDLLFRPAAAFLYRYAWLQGFRDGWRGLISSVYVSLYVFLSRAKLWEIQELGLGSSPK